MKFKIGHQAVVIGAGIGGLSAAGALADYFDHVVIVERDTLPSSPNYRRGVPQGRHLHILRAGGLDALERLFPGFSSDLVAAGAIPFRAGLDLHHEMPGFDPFPRRDLGRYTFYSMTRPLLEQTLRLHVQRKDNVRIEEKYRVRALEVNSASASVCGVEGEMANGRSSVIPSTLVVDASGHGTLTLRLLEKMALPQPEQSTIGVDISYRTAILTLPGFVPDWKGAMTFPELAASTRGANLVPLEGNRWIFGLRGSHGDSPPADWEGYLEYTSQLRTTTLFEVLKRAKREGEIAPYLFAESLWRHFERLKYFPQGILPLGDVICRLNPLAAQGLSIAAKEALLLGEALESLANEREPLARLAPRFFQTISGMIQDCWSAVALNDFVHPKTRGQRPIDFAARRNFKLALISLAALDPQIHSLLLEVDDLLKPLSALNAPEIAERVRSIQRVDSRGGQSATTQVESPRDSAISIQI